MMWSHHHQLGRVAWYLGHALAAARLSTPVMDDLPSGLPDRKAYLGDLMTLLRRDRAHVEAGRYRPAEEGSPLGRKAFRESTRFLSDIGRINLRRMRRDGLEVARKGRGEGKAKGKPAYYLQNFHYQTDGWLSDRSAELYDFQVDVLFNGATDAMRRQALLPIADILKGRRIADMRLLDVGCGTGRFLRAVKRNFPRLPVTGLDLSVAYLAKAEVALSPWCWRRLVEAKAEQLPMADESQDIVTTVYLLHELPATVRRQAVKEMARVLKPGGRLILVDSLQHGDHPPFDGLLDLFPVLYHEPYYKEYARSDLIGLFADHGLTPSMIDRAFMSKIMALTKTA